MFAAQIKIAQVEIMKFIITNLFAEEGIGLVTKLR